MENMREQIIDLLPFEVTDELIANNRNELNNFYRNVKNCESCYGFNSCKNELPGYFVELVLNATKKYCIQTMTQCNKYPGIAITRHSGVDKIKQISISDIHKTKQREELLTHLDKIIADIQENKLTNEKGLYISGDLGIGKSFIAQAYCNELNKLGLDVAIVFAPDMFRQMKNTANIESELQIYKQTDVLLLDDLFSNTLKTWSGISDLEDILLPILNHRMENDKLTIITSNILLDQIIDRIDDKKTINELDINAKRLVERIRYLCKFYLLEGKNLRNEER